MRNVRLQSGHANDNCPVLVMLLDDAVTEVWKLNSDDRGDKGAIDDPESNTFSSFLSIGERSVEWKLGVVLLNFILDVFW